MCRPVEGQIDPGATKLKQLHQTLQAATCDLINSVTYPDYTPYCGEVFDFIVVGAGSAGSVVASRLSENPNWRVLLLEAGGDPDVTSEIPYLAGRLLGSHLDWQYTTEPDESTCLGLKDRRCKYPQGKVLGGTSSINGMLYVRGQPEVYNSWEREGNLGWGYKRLLPYFKKAEDLESDIIREQANYKCYHGECGYLTVDTIYQVGDFRRFFLNISRGFGDLGYGTFSDVNSKFQDGLFTLQGTVRDGRRCSTAKAYIKPAQQRDNLKISKCSIVTQILFTPNLTAYGIIFEKAGMSNMARARKEVIVSGGAVNSPQLLMLSGIGPKDHLEKLKIPVISDLKVGCNLQDHYVLRGYFFSLDSDTKKPDDDEPFVNSLFNKKVTYNVNSRTNAVGYITTSRSSFRNIQFSFSLFATNTSDSVGQASEFYIFSQVHKQSLISINRNRSLVGVAHVLVKPKSTGVIRLRSSNARDHPLIYPNFLAEEEDIQAVLEGIAFSNRLMNTESMKKLGARVEYIDIPECRPFVFQSADYWRCLMKYSGQSFNHPAGTCRMGPRGYPESVVDPDLRVIGVSGLRVVDASVMPSVPNGNINAPVIAVAEKASDLIKCFWKDRP